MSYARPAAVAGAMVLGLALGLRAQEPTPELKGGEAPPSKTAPSSTGKSKSSRPRDQSPDKPSYKTGNDAKDPKSAQDATLTSDSAQAAPRSEPIPPDAQEIQFSFLTQPWESVLQWLAELSGLSLQMDVKPPGTFNYINDPKKYTIGEAMDVLNAQLVPKGYTLIRKNNYLKVLPLSEPIPPDLVPRVSPEELDKRGESEIVSVIFPIKTLAAGTAAKEIDGLKGQYGKIVALDSANRVMITDTVSNIRLMRDLLDQIDGAGTRMQSTTRAFPLQYASAIKVEANLRELLGLQPRTSATNQPGQRSGTTNPQDDWRNRMRQMFEGGAGGGGSPFGFMMGGAQGGDSRGGDEQRGRDRGGSERGGRDSGSSQQQATQKDVTLAVDEPHNTIIVKAPVETLSIVEGVIAELDKPRPGQDPFEPRESQSPTVIPYRLSDGDAQSLVTALKEMYQNTAGVRFSADPTNNMVIAIATPDDQKEIKKLVDQFEHDERDSVVLPLSVLDATAVMDLLTSVYSSGQRDWRGNTTPRPGQPRIVADRTRNQLMVRGSKKQVEDIRAMLASLGETPPIQFTGSDKLRVIPLNSANSQAIQGQLEQYWKQARPNNNPIKIIDLNKRSDGEIGVPSNAEPRQLPDGLRRKEDRRSSPPADETPRTPRDRSRSGTDRRDWPRRDATVPLKFVSHVVTSSAQSDQDEAQTTGNEQARKESPAQAEEGPPLVVSFGPDNVVIASDDPEAVQRMTNLILSLTRSSGGFGSRYTVFYLKAADVTQVQQTLSDLMGVSSASSLFGSSSAATTTLKMVPDTRTNSLIVYGSAADVDRVSQMLDVLDRDDAPSSGAVSAPRIIPVRYSNATTVARVVRDVYASRMVSGAGGAGGFGGPGFAAGGFSPFGANGGAPVGSSNRSSRSGAGTLAVGIDEQSNSLVVSCSEALYLEVKKLVETLDIAANDTQRTVQIVTVKNSTPTAVQDALNGLMGLGPRGRSTTGSDPFNRGGSGGTPFGGPTMITPFGGGNPFGGFQQGGSSPFGGSSFNRGDSGGFDRGRSFDRGSGGGSPFGGGGNFGGGNFGGGNFGGSRRP